MALYGKYAAWPEKLLFGATGLVMFVGTLVIFCGLAFGIMATVPAVLWFWWNFALVGVWPTVPHVTFLVVFSGCMSGTIAFIAFRCAWDENYRANGRHLLVDLRDYVRDLSERYITC